MYMYMYMLDLDRCKANIKKSLNINVDSTRVSILFISSRSLQAFGGTFNFAI